MNIFESLDALGAPPEGCILTIGNFDGVHRGHAKIFSRVVEEARRTGGTAALITFDPHPAKLLRPDVAPLLLTTREQKLRHFQEAGIDRVLILTFTRTLCRTPATAFIEDVVVPHFRPRTIYIGTPFRFGHRRQGDVALLAELGERHGFRAEGVGVVDEAGETISSTRIRSALLEGRADDAARMLGRPYEIEAVVVAGEGRGKQLRFPTANLAARNELIPADGVYATRLRVGGALLPSVTNIGGRPTFAAAGRTVEAHALDYDGDLYGRDVGLQFVERLREERRFPSPAALVAQIRQDVEHARRILGPHAAKP